METEIKERQEELERVSNVTGIEAGALALLVGESKEFKIMDLEAYQRLRTRFNRVKNNSGRCFTTKLSGNKVVVTRIEDEEVR
jgi:hypothetical protein